MGKSCMRREGLWGKERKKERRDRDRGEEENGRVREPTEGKEGRASSDR